MISEITKTATIPSTTTSLSLPANNALSLCLCLSPPLSLSPSMLQRTTLLPSKLLLSYYHSMTNNVLCLFLSLSLYLSLFLQTSLSLFRTRKSRTPNSDWNPLDVRRGATLVRPSKHLKSLRVKRSGNYCSNMFSRCPVRQGLGTL